MPVTQDDGSKYCRLYLEPVMENGCGLVVEVLFTKAFDDLLAS